MAANVPAGSPLFLTTFAKSVDETYVARQPTAPIKLPGFKSTDLPLASRFVGCLIWISNLNVPAFSDGTNWYPLSHGAAL